MQDQSNVINKHKGAGKSVADVTVRNHLAEARGFSPAHPGQQASANSRILGSGS